MPRHFPHLLPLDRELWIDFLDLPANVYKDYQYDVKVGNGRDPGPDFPDHMRQMALNISRRRIVAIGFTGTTPTIIEISTNAGLTPLVQLIAYHSFSKIQTPQSPQPQTPTRSDDRRYLLISKPHSRSHRTAKTLRRPRN